MKKASVLAVGLLMLGLVDVPAPAQTAAKSGGNAAVEQDLQKIETSLWEAMKNHDAKPFERYLPDDFTDVRGDGMHQGKAAAIMDITSGNCTVNSYSLSGFHYLWLDTDHVVMIYQSTQDRTCGGKKGPGKDIYSSVWSKKGGKWMNPFHQGTPQSTAE